MIIPATKDIHAHASLPQDIITQVETLQQSIAYEIENGLTKIASQPEFVQGKQAREKTSLANKLRQLGSIKEELKNKLNKIAVEEKQIKFLAKKIDSSQTRAKRERSVMTEEDKDRIALLKKQRTQFQLLMREKINKVIEQVKEKEKEEEVEKTFQSDLKRKERIIKLAQSRARIDQKRSKTLQMLENSQLRINRSEYTYVKNEVKDRRLEQERQKYYELMLKQKRQKLKIDFNEIRDSALEHDKIIRQKRQDFLFELKESEIRKRTKTVAYESQFSRKLKSEQELKQIQKLKQMEAKKEVRQRIMKFQSLVDEKYKPKASEESVFIPKKEVEVLVKLSYQEAREKGDEFLRIAKKKGKKILQLDESKIEISSDQMGPKQSLPTSTSDKYPNYLAELKKGSKEENLFERMMKEKRLSSRKVEEVIRWMQKKEEGSNIGFSKSPIRSQYSSALEKIQLLNSLYQGQSLEG